MGSVRPRCLVPNAHEGHSVRDQPVPPTIRGHRLAADRCVRCRVCGSHADRLLPKWKAGPGRRFGRRRQVCLATLAFNLRSISSMPCSLPVARRTSGSLPEASILYAPRCPMLRFILDEELGRLPGAVGPRSSCVSSRGCHAERPRGGLGVSEGTLSSRSPEPRVVSETSDPARLAVSVASSGVCLESRPSMP